ncbi:hypothetical protein TWF281_007843 [Arthrobotrys megalospora]
MTPQNERKRKRYDSSVYPVSTAKKVRLVPSEKASSVQAPDSGERPRYDADEETLVDPDNQMIWETVSNSSASLAGGHEPESSSEYDLLHVRHNQYKGFERGHTTAKWSPYNDKKTREQVMTWASVAFPSSVEETNKYSKYPLSIEDEIPDPTLMDNLGLRLYACAAQLATYDLFRLGSVDMACDSLLRSRSLAVGPEGREWGLLDCRPSLCDTSLRAGVLDHY